jgi:hypothetical protein
MGINVSSANRSALLFGLALIIVGVLFLLYNLGAIPPQIARLWPALVIAPGAWLLGRAVLRRRGGVVGGVILLTAGIFLLLQNFGRVRPEAFGPVMLMAVGAGLLLRGFARAT